ncbi:hypothetical protein J2X14_000791 [Pantoea alhagi]|uniref:Ig-like domain-containing protein n=1 Tax=Mixta sp. BE291 TaxID=3158787 RepID=UPI0028643D44|nr:hypothetical protein [Pantoea alhagi]
MASKNSVSRSEGGLVTSAIQLASPIIIDSFSGDEVLNSREKLVEQRISGHVSADVAVGENVTVEAFGQRWQATVGNDRVWSLQIPASNILAFPDGDALISAMVNTLQGAQRFAEKTVTLQAGRGNEYSARIDVDTVADKAILNAIVAEDNLSFSGRTYNVASGKTVTVTLNDQDYTTLVQPGGIWRITVPNEDIQALPDGKVSLLVSVADLSETAATSQQLLVAHPLYQPITIDNVSGDDSVYGREKRVDQVISGMLDENSDDWHQLTVLLNGKNYNATLTNEGAWSVVIPSADMLALPVGNVLLRVQALSENGDIYTSNKIIDVAGGRGNSYSAQVTLNPLAEDSVFNALENYQDLVVSGRAYHAASGKIITVTLNGEHYTTELQDGGYWKLSIPHDALHTLSLGSATLLASLADLGETATSVQIINVDKPQPQITLDPFTGDNSLSLAETQVDQLLSGTTQHVQSGQNITITLNGQDYSAVTSTDGRWETLIPAADLQVLINDSEVIEAKVTTEWGVDVSTSELLRIQDPPRGVITISPISEDQILSPDEALNPLTISGTLEGPFAPGSEIEMVINESMYYTIPEGSTWSFTLSPAQLALLDGGSNIVYVRTNDAFGREVSAVQSLLVDKSDAADALTLETLGMQAHEHDIALLLADEKAEPAQDNVTMPTEQPVSLAGTVDEIWNTAMQERMSETSNLPVMENTLAEILVQHNLDARMV